MGALWNCIIFVVSDGQKTEYVYKWFVGLLDCKTDGQSYEVTVDL